MHLVIVSPFPPAITGVGQYGYHITRALANSGSFSRVTVLAGSPDQGELHNHLYPLEIEYCWEPDQPNARQRILSRVRQLNPDLIWFNLRVAMFGQSIMRSISGLFTPVIARWMGYPTIVTFHEMIELSDFNALNSPGGSFAPLGARLVTDIATQADIVCLTMREHVDLFAVKRPNVDCVHIPNGAFQEPEILEEKDRPELLLFNMLAPFKGVELLLEVFPSLQKDYPDLKLTIAGEEHPRFPGYIKALKKRFSDLQCVDWPGQIPDEDVIELFRRAQIVVLPYRASTGSSSVLYQAATWGRAVVASDLQELRALARENNFQVEFFENGNAESLRNAIRTLLASPSRRFAQAKNNFKEIQDMRLEKTCRRYLNAFNRALEKHKNPKRISLPNVEMKFS